eukprot:CAMPEP_0119406552 /NCGR_PEP_ID=MMETSP1335-20130426/836_1 /TAXON_ID=259385 /ORGANISM="Chrysoculter rhomboideus, Strain RCC1486" /LENGTH=306 /DNA_ID=CAMNT_0007430633 /DNA_START=26 /DNA_END=946 /DNA_ORIENTATION=+
MNAEEDGSMLAEHSPSDGHKVQRNVISHEDLFRTEAADEWPDLAEHTWILAHKAIAHDLEDTSEALERMANEVELESWEIDLMKLWWSRCAENIVLHHSQEEEILFPYLRSKMDIPSHVSEEHEALLALMPRVAKAFEGLGDSTVPEDCLRLIDQLEECMVPHMRGEEIAILPVMMKHFKPREILRIEREMVKGLSPLDLPHFYRPFGRDMETKREHFQRSKGKPGFVFDFFASKAFEEYDDVYTYAIDVLKAPHKKGWLDEQRMMRYASNNRGVACVPGGAHAPGLDSRRASATITPAAPAPVPV